jgi:hypothetical protein
LIERRHAAAGVRVAKRLRNDSSHPANDRAKKAVQWSRSFSTQSNVTHHSANARLPSTTGVTRIVAAKSCTGYRNGSRNS